MTQESRKRLQAAIAEAKAREDEEKRERRRQARQEAKFERWLSKAAEPLIDVMQTFLQTMAQHGNPGTEEVMLGGRGEQVPTGKLGWPIVGRPHYAQKLWVCPDGTGAGGYRPDKVVSLHEAAHDYLACHAHGSENGFRIDKAIDVVVEDAGAILQRYGIKL
jgi:hypothetical protein